MRHGLMPSTGITATFGIKCILKRLEDYGILRQTKSFDVRIIFGGYGLSATEPKQEAIEELRQAAEKANAHVDAGELVPA
jgi:hypothetical protein